MAKSTVFKEKPKAEEKELLKITKTEKYYHPVETFSLMSENMKKQSEGTKLNPYVANEDLKTAENADKLRMASQTPVAERFYHLVKSLKG